jgi:hypothetical protein
MIQIGDNGCLVFSSRSKTCPSWPVRVVGKQGLWRYVGIVPDSNTFGDIFVEVIGPFFPSNPSRNGGRSRIVNIDELKYAGKHAKPVDVLNVESTAISQRAQRR